MDAVTACSAESCRQRCCETRTAAGTTRGFTDMDCTTVGSDTVTTLSSGQGSSGYGSTGTCIPARSTSRRASLLATTTSITCPWSAAFLSGGAVCYRWCGLRVLPALAPYGAVIWWCSSCRCRCCVPGKRSANNVVTVRQMNGEACCTDVSRCFFDEGCYNRVDL